MADRSLGFNISTSQDFTRAVEAMIAAAEKLTRSIDKLDGKIARIQVRLDGKEKAEAGLDELDRKREKLDGKTARVKVDIDKRSFADAANAWALLSRNLQSLALPAGIALATPWALDLANAALTASQSLLLLPAAGAAAAAVMGTVKVGVSGISDALKQVFAAKQNPEALALALAQLSPQARAFVGSIQAMKGELTGLKIDVQDALFRGLSGTLSQLGGIYLPVVRAGFVSIASPINELIQTTGAWLARTQSVADVKTIFDNVSASLYNVGSVGADIVQIFLDIASVGSSFLPGLANGFATLADNVAAFVAHARETGQLHEWISHGLDALGNLIQLVIEVGRILGAVLRAAQTDSNGFLDTLVRGAAVVANFLNSAQGQSALVEVFTNLRALGAALMPLFIAIGGAALAMFNQVAPALPPLIKGITDVFAASGPLLGIFGQLAVAILPALGSALSTLAPILGPLLVVITAANTATSIYSTTLAVVALATKAFGIAQAIALVATNGWSIAQAAAAAEAKGLAAAQWALNLAMDANPIGLIVVALVALAAALVYAWNNSETFRNIVMTAWADIQSAASTAWTFLQGMFASFMQAMADVGAGFTTFGQACMDLWNNYVIPAWNGIVEAIRFAITLILTVIFAPLLIAINVLIPGGMDGLVAKFQAAWALIGQIVQLSVSILVAIWTGMNNFITGAMTAAQNAFSGTISTVWAVIHAVIQVAWSIIQPLWLAMNALLLGPMSAAQNIFLGVARGAWQALTTFLGQMWGIIRDTIFQPLVNFVTNTLPGGFRTGVDIVRTVWAGIRAALRDPVNAAINLVWNNGIVSVWNRIAEIVGLGTRLSPVFMASGGPVRGGVPGKDSVPIVGMPGEYMLSKPAVDRMGGIGAVDSMHRSLTGTGGAPRVVGGRYAMAVGGPVPPADPSSLLGTIGHYGGSTQWGSAVGGLLAKLTTAAVDYLRGKIATWLASLVAVPVGPGGSFTGAGASLSSAVGGGGAMQWIIAHESGGNPRAQNPTSSASGLFQMIDGTWKAYGGSTAHAKDASVAEQQAVASRYVASRYGSWENAQRFWAAHHYYDRGGMLMPGTTMATNATGMPERILSPSQTRVWDALSTAPRRGHDGGDLISEVRRLNGSLMMLRGDVDHHGDNAAIAARLDLTNRILAGAVSGGSARGAEANRVTSELGPF